MTKNIKSVIGLILAAGMCGIFLFSQTVSSVATGTGTQGYSSDNRLDVGTIVQIADGAQNKVKVATEAEVQNMFGVVVDPARLSVKLSQSHLKNETFVAASGTHPVLVSTQEGAIKSGDYVTLSAINGIGMKTGTQEVTVFGRALESFDGKSNSLGKMTLKDEDGKDARTVEIGSISVAIDIRSNPNEDTTMVDAPDFLLRVGQAIAEKEVSPIRIYLSMAITAVSLIAAIAILYSGVRNGVISIGRNPMSKKSIFRALAEIILTSILVLVVGLFAVYLLLRL